MTEILPVAIYPVIWGPQYLLFAFPDHPNYDAPKALRQSPSSSIFHHAYVAIMWIAV